MLVQTEQLTKCYGPLTALDACTLGVDDGEVFGLLGPNGAGKTTLLRLLLGYLKPSSGSAAIDGLDCHHQSVEVRRLVSYLPGDARLFRQMRGRDVLRFFSEVRCGEDFGTSLELAERLELDISRRVSMMSTGMRQKLALAATMAADTPLAILDEPTSNLDPTIRGIVLQMVAEARAAGRTIIFSSHVLSEVESVCDRVAFLRAGALVHLQVMSELKRRHRIRAVLKGFMPAPPAQLRRDIVIRTEEDGSTIIDTPGELSPLLSWLASVPLEEMTIEPVGLRPLYDQLHSTGSSDVSSTSRPQEPSLG